MESKRFEVSLRFKVQPIVESFRLSVGACWILKGTIFCIAAAQTLKRSQHLQHSLLPELGATHAEIFASPAIGAWIVGGVSDRLTEPVQSSEFQGLNCLGRS